MGLRTLLLSLYLLLITLSACCQEAPCIIYLKGTCSAGKSTFIRELSKQCDACEVVDEDAIMMQAYVDAVKMRFRQEWNFISQVIAQENLYHALREEEVLFKKTATQEERIMATKLLTAIQEELNQSHNLAWKESVSKGITAKALNKIQEALSNNSSVILDSWYIKPKELQELFPKIKVVRVLLYCPFPVAYERFLKRNKEALDHEKLQEKRYPRQLVGTFFSLYQPSKEPLQPICKVKKHELNGFLTTLAASFKESEGEYKKPIFTFGEVPRSYYLGQKNEFLKPFETLATDVLYLAPKQEYDLIKDNSKESMQKSVEAVMKLLTPPQSLAAA